MHLDTRPHYVSRAEEEKRAVMKAQVARVKAYEGPLGKPIDFGGMRYVHEMHGLEVLLSALWGGNVLVLGGGNGRGVGELASMYPGVDFSAAGLIRRPEVKQNLGDHRFFEASPENLRPVPKHSADLVLDLMESAYATDPDEVVRQISRVLAFGGIYKGVFPSKDSRVGLHDTVLPLIPGEPFKVAFARFGYDVAKTSDISRDILVAVKHGGPRAHDLLKADQRQYQEWEAQRRQAA